VENVRGLTGIGNIAAPTIPATSSALINPYPFRVGVFLTGFNQVSLAGVQTGAAAPPYLELLPGQQIGVAYAGTPSWKWFSL